MTPRGQDHSGIQTEDVMKYGVNITFTELDSCPVNVLGGIRGLAKHT